MRSNRTGILVFITFAICSLSHYRSYKTFSRLSIDNSKVLTLFQYFNDHYSFIYKNTSVVLGADDNPIYLFPLPITVLFWRRLGIKSIVCFSNSTNNFKDESSQLVLRALRILQAQLIFLNTSLAPSHTIAQTCRLYVASSPEVSMPDSHLLITSDSDLWSFKLENHVPIDKQKIFLYNSECCGMTSKPSNNESQFPMRPMATIAMSARLWRELMGLIWKCERKQYTFDHLRSREGLAERRRCPLPAIV
ncbi:unnamed protein product [Auanema sp. JU1783]|nr:unnamed protein product [Auanema sp. JU1783]